MEPIEIMGSGDRIWECAAQLVMSIELCLYFAQLVDHPLLSKGVHHVLCGYTKKLWQAVIKPQSIPAWKVLEISFSLQTTIFLMVAPAPPANKTQQDVSILLHSRRRAPDVHIHLFIPTLGTHRHLLHPT